MPPNVAGIRANFLKPARLDAAGRLRSPGVLLVYSHNFPLYLEAAAREPELARTLRERFVVVGAFAWHPPEAPESVAQALELRRRGLLHLVMQRVAADFFRARGFAAHEIIPLSIGDLLDPEVFRPRGGAKEIDVLSISRLRRWKRIELILNAVAELNRRGRALRCLILRSGRGRGPDPGYPEELAALIRREGLGRAVTITTVPDAEVPTVLARAKVSVVASAVEGECRAITESLFCDVPVLAMEGMRGGGIAYFTPACGRLTTPARFTADLAALLDHCAAYRPREYIRTVTGLPVAWPRLAAALGAYFAATGRELAGELVAPDYMQMLKTGTETLDQASLAAWTRAERGAPPL